MPVYLFMVLLCVLSPFKVFLFVCLFVCFLIFVVVWYLSSVQLFAIPWTITHQAPLSMEFSRQEYWSGMPCPSPGDLPDPGIELMSPMSPALAGGFFTAELPGKPSFNL